MIIIKLACRSTRMQICALCGVTPTRECRSRSIRAGGPGDSNFFSFFLNFILNSAPFCLRPLLARLRILSLRTRLGSARLGRPRPRNQGVRGVWIRSYIPFALQYWLGPESTKRRKRISFCWRLMSWSHACDKLTETPSLSKVGTLLL